MAVSLAIVSPTLAVSLNPQAIAEQVGGAIPLVYLISLVPVLLIAGGFAVLASRYKSVGSVVGLFRQTAGPRVAAISGFLLVGAYVMTFPGTLAAFGLFVEAAVFRLTGVMIADFWLLVMAVMLLVGGYIIALRPIRSVGNVLLSIEGLSVLVIVAVSLVGLGVMLSGGGSAEQQVTFTDFSLAGVSVSAIGIALTFAVVSVAGFEGAASVGESMRNPLRSVPMALVGTAVGAIVFYALVASVGVWAFGEEAADFASFSVASALPASLADEFTVPAVGTFVTFTAAATCLASVIGACVAGSRMFNILARQSLLPTGLAGEDATTGEPRSAMALTVISGAIASLLCLVLVGGEPFRVFELAGAVAGFLYLVVYAMVCSVALRLMVQQRAPHRGVADVPRSALCAGNLRCHLLPATRGLGSVGSGDGTGDRCRLSGSWPSRVVWKNYDSRARPSRRSSSIMRGRTSASGRPSSKRSR